MVTVVNTPGGTNSGDSSGGWAVAVIVLIALIAIGGFFAWRYYRAPAAAPTGGANINVTVPTPGGGGGGGAEAPAQ